MFTSLAVYVGEVFDIRMLGAYSIFLQFVYGDQQGIRYIYVLPSSIYYKLFSLNNRFKEIDSKKVNQYVKFETKVSSVRELELALPKTEVVPIDADNTAMKLAKGF